MVIHVNNYNHFCWLGCLLDDGSWQNTPTELHYLCVLCRAFVPAVLLGEAEPKVNEQSAKTQEQPTVRNQCPGFC